MLLSLYIGKSKTSANIYQINWSFLPQRDCSLRADKFPKWLTLHVKCFVSEASILQTGLVLIGFRTAYFVLSVQKRRARHQKISWEACHSSKRVRYRPEAFLRSGRNEDQLMTRSGPSDVNDCKPLSIERTCICQEFNKTKDTGTTSTHCFVNTHHPMSTNQPGHKLNWLESALVAFVSVTKGHITMQLLCHSIVQVGVNISVMPGRSIVFKTKRGSAIVLLMFLRCVFEFVVSKQTAKRQEERFVYLAHVRPLDGFKHKSCRRVLKSAWSRSSSSPAVVGEKVFRTLMIKFDQTSSPFRTKRPWLSLWPTFCHSSTCNAWKFWGWSSDLSTGISTQKESIGPCNILQGRWKWWLTE